MIIGVTGHRLGPKLGGYGLSAFERLVKIFRDYLKQELYFHKASIQHVVTGMAIGWDQAVARACIHEDVPFIAAVPFIGQERKWPPHSQALYIWLMQQAKEVIVVSEGRYSPFKMQIRNQWIVDNSDRIVTMWGGDTAGGTWNCLKYAKEKNIPVENLYSEWLENK